MIPLRLVSISTTRVRRKAERVACFFPRAVPHLLNVEFPGFGNPGGISPDADSGFAGRQLTPAKGFSCARPVGPKRRASPASPLRDHGLPAIRQSLTDKVSNNSDQEWSPLMFR